MNCAEPTRVVTISCMKLSSLFLTLGVQTVFASFFLSVLGLRRR